MFDTILRGGTVIDGTGRPAFPADVPSPLSATCPPPRRAVLWMSPAAP